VIGVIMGNVDPATSINTASDVVFMVANSPLGKEFSSTLESRS
jgi:hypothetical protein